MIKKRMLTLSGGIIALALLVAGSGVGTHIGSQIAEAAATCGDLVKCNKATYVLKVNNTGEGNAIVATSQSSSTDKAAVKGEATKKARGVYGKSKNGVGVFGESTSAHGLKGVSNSSSSSKAAVYGVSTNSARGVYGKHNSSGNYGYLGSGYEGVYGNSTSFIGVYGKSSSGTGVCAASVSGSLIEAYDISGVPDLRFKVALDGKVTADGAFTGGGADFADMSPAVSGLKPADVLVIGHDGKLALSSQPYSTAVAGVYSTKPGFIGGKGMDEDTTGKVPLAIVGTVPAKASAENGPICPGDLLTTSSTLGHAMKATDVKTGTIIGKAMETLESGTGTIQILVTLQ